MKRTTRFLDDTLDGSNAISARQASESLHEISVNTPTLRDQFAMAALQGLCANEQCKPFSFSCDVVGTAKLAYKMADAMMEARK